MKNVHVKISGRVQGVWYRASTKQKAESLGIKGWVRNTDEGCVEAVFEGEDEIVDEMISWCRRGPPMSHVKNVDIKTQNLSNLEGFEIKQ